MGDSLACAGLSEGEGESFALEEEMVAVVVVASLPKEETLGCAEYVETAAVVAGGALLGT